MDELKFRKNVAANIARCRKAAGMTQGALAEKLNYSDKSVSKWERAEGMPDAYVLYRMAELFGVSVDELINGNAAARGAKKKDNKKVIITVLAVCIVWLVAAVIYFAFGLLPFSIDKSWLCFVFAVLVSFIVLTVFTCLWFNMAARAVSVSGIVWGAFSCLIATFNPRKMLPLIIVASILQLMTVLWFYMRHRSAEKEETENEAEDTAV